jgi:glycosyltransferase involved in cell wall biosynthesis
MALYGALSHDSRVQREAQTLAEAGHRVTILCLPGGEIPALDPRIDVRSYEPRSTSVRPGSPSPYAFRTPTFVARLAWVIRYVANLKAWGRWAVRQVEPDIWHAHDLPALEAISSVLDRTVAVYDSHELYLEAGTPARLPAILRSLLRWRESRLIARVDAVITVNPSIAGELAARYGKSATVVMNCPPRRLEMPPGVMRQRLDLGNRPIVMYHGGASADRGIETMIRALELLPPDVCFVVLGDGPLTTSISALEGNGSIPGRVRWHPSVSVAELPEWIVDADVGIILFAPVELNNVLATPNKLFEYMNCAVPVVVSRFPELERIVTETGCGIAADPVQPGDVAAAILRLLGTDAERAEIGLRGYAAAQQQYNWETQAKQLLVVYRGLD